MRSEKSGVWVRVIIIAGAAFFVCTLIAVFGGKEGSSSHIPTGALAHGDAPPPAAPANGAAPVRREAPPAINEGIARAVRESQQAVKEKQKRDADKARAAAQEAEAKRLAAAKEVEARRTAAAREADAKRAAVAREADYEAWKVRRKATMEESATHLRPDQVATWNRAMAAWNKLTPAQREAAYRQEYQQQMTNSENLGVKGPDYSARGGADLSKSSISDADWARAQAQAVPKQLIPHIPGMPDYYTDGSPVAPPPPAPTVAVQPAPPIASSPPSPAPVADDGGAAVPMIREDGVLKLPVRINDAIQLKFIVDSGASTVQIPEEVFLTLKRTDTIQVGDNLPAATYRNADGKSTKRPRFILRSLRVGNTTVTNVEALVGEANSPLLLGQSFLSRFREWKIDNRSGTLLLEQ